MQIKFKVDERQLKQIFDNFQSKQLPFALALTATNLAKGAQGAEKAAMRGIFDNPTPFTLNSMAVTAATKGRPVATVFAKPIAAAYLAPYLDGGLHSLGSKKGLLVPKNVGLNQYGNLSRNKVKQLLAMPNTFVGSVRGVNGIWQRIPPQPVKTGRGGRHRVQKDAAKAVGGLKLLIRFEDPLPVRKRFDFQGIAAKHVQRNAAKVFAAAYAQAVKPAK